MDQTRLIVKNLPDTVTEVKLKELFQSQGTVTDVQLKRFENGKFRGFAFVGYQTGEEAVRARDYFHKAFFGAAKMEVGICYPLNDPNKPKPWSKHTKQKIAEASPPSKKKKKKESNQLGEEEEEEGASLPKKVKRKEEELLEKAQNDPDFLEFLQVHDQKTAKWGNDTVLDTLEKLVSKKKDPALPPHLQPLEEEVELEQVMSNPTKKGKGEKKSPAEKPPPPEDTFFTVKLRNLPKKTKKKDLKAFFAPLVPKSIRTPPNLRGFAYVGFLTESEQKKALSKNRSILLGNPVVVKKYTSRSVLSASTSAKTNKWDSQRRELDTVAEAVEESGRIFVRNLPYTVTEPDLKAEFEKFGPVTEVHLPVDRLTRRPKGFAFISFLLPDQAAKAFETLDGSTFQGRMLHLLPSKPKQDEEGDESGAGSSYKKDKERKLKKGASTHTWNSLFLGQNAVSALAAERYGVSRETLLLQEGDEHSSSVAVRMALAETEIVGETKKWLETNGVALESFEEKDGRKRERSTTSILVKNLVAGTTENELREMFEKWGPVGRVVLPPVGITGIVEFMVGSEARAAFSKLAYTPFKGMPLYLEWAPVDVFTAGSKKSKKQISTATEATPTPTPTRNISSTPLEDERQLPNYEGDEEPFDEENMVPEPETTLFVKNLNFSTGEPELKRHFNGVGRVFGVTVARKKDPKTEGALLSQGFGFVQFYRAKDTAKALITLQQSMLQNHSLELKMSSRTLASEKDTGKRVEGKGNKILVRNVPFQASEEEITDLFKVFGKLKAVRMPKKAMGETQHRGFAFIDYFVEANAKTAFETLSKSTHIYGRRLVLEWAAKDASVEELRDKVAKQYGSSLTGTTSGGGESTKKQLRRYFETSAPNKTSAPAEEEEDDE